jgi:hypothetical protein
MGFFELGTAESMLKKARRELTRLVAEDSIDHVYNFFVTAYHISDYLDDSAKEAIRADPLIMLCADACNKAKHMRLRRSRPDVETRSRFWGALNTAPCNKIALNKIRVERWIIWEDGGTLEVVKFARDVIAKWDEFFGMPGEGGSQHNARH